MSESRDEMIKSLKELVIPKLRDKKFRGSFPHFRRTVDGKTNLLTFQFDKNGGGFVIETANFEESEFKTHWGKIIPLNKLKASYLSHNERCRFYPENLVEENGTDSWFRYDNDDSEDIYIKNCVKVINRIPLMERFWSNA